MKNNFFLFFLAAIVLARTIIFIYPNVMVTVGDVRAEHYMLGVVLILVGIFSRSVILYSLGLGLFIDQLAYLIIGGKTDQDYFSEVSMLGTLGFVIVILLCRECFMKPVLFRED